MAHHSSSKTLQLLNKAKALSQELNKWMKEKNHLEESFLAQHKNKPIFITTLKGQEKQGILKNMNRFRIELEINGKEYFFSKGNILSFYA